MQEYSSRLFEQAVDEFSKLPGIGRKTAVRLVLHLLRLDAGMVDRFAGSLQELVRGIHYCTVCHNLSDNDVCSICSDSLRDHSTVCVVENVQDVMAIESTGEYHGLYHVLGGVISPMEGLAPSDLNIESLTERVGKGEIREVILALPSTMEGDTTGFFIARRLSAWPEVTLTVLARGMSVNDELQYTDEVKLGRSIVNRVPFK